MNKKLNQKRIVVEVTRIIGIVIQHKKKLLPTTGEKLVTIQHP